MKATDILYTVSMGGVILLMVVTAFAAGLNYGTTRPNCFEDEVLAVQEDRDPSHGLTWACVNTEEFIAAAAR